MSELEVPETRSTPDGKALEAPNVYDMKNWAGTPGDLKPVFKRLPGLYLDGTGDFASTPDADVLDITDILDVRVAAAPLDWTTTEFRLIDKWVETGDERSWAFTVNSSGVPVLYWSEDGTAAGVLSSSPTVGFGGVDGKPLCVRVRFDVTIAGTIPVFYKRTFFPNTFMEDLEDDTTHASDPALGWVALANPAVTTTTSIFSSTAPMSIGGGTSNYLTGSVFGAVVKQGTDGLIVANPNFFVREERTEDFDDDAGLTWSMNGNAYMQPNFGMNEWLFCDGATLDIAKYPKLFEAIGNVAGGDGVTTFAVPNATDMYMRGSLTPGGTGGSLTSASGGVHGHTVVAGEGAHAHVSNTPNEAAVAVGTGAANAARQNHTHNIASSGTHTHTINDATSHTHTVTPPYLYVGWLIHI